MSHARKLSLVLVVAASVAAALSAFAEDTPARVRGTLQKMDGNNLTIANKGGKEANVPLKDGAPIIAVTKGAMSDIKSNTFVGITAMPQPDGTQKAVEVHVFEESLRGTGEGHYPWDLMPDSTMTNGAVAQQVQKVEGNTLQVKYKDGEKTIVVPSDAEVVNLVAGGKADLKTGAHVFIPRWEKQGDGTWQATVRFRLTIRSPAAISNGKSFPCWNPKRSACSSGVRLPAACFPASSAGRTSSPRTRAALTTDFPVVDKERTWKILDVMAPIAKAHGCSPARLSLAWLLAKPVVTSVIIGAKRLDQLQDNLAAVELTLTQDELRQLDEVSALAPEYPGWVLPFQGADRLGPVDRWERLREARRPHGPRADRVPGHTG
jgi:Aldo/keto reductase family